MVLRGTVTTIRPNPSDLVTIGACALKRRAVQYLDTSYVSYSNFSTEFSLSFRLNCFNLWRMDWLSQNWLSCHLLAWWLWMYSFSHSASPLLSSSDYYFHYWPIVPFKLLQSIKNRLIFAKLALVSRAGMMTAYSVSHSAYHLLFRLLFHYWSIFSTSRY